MAPGTSDPSRLSGGIENRGRRCCSEWLGAHDMVRLPCAPSRRRPCLSGCGEPHRVAFFLLRDPRFADLLPFGGGGTLAPFFRASESPMAIACRRLFTFPPCPFVPRRSVPFLRRRMALSTLRLALGPYFRLLDFRLLEVRLLEVRLLDFRLLDLPLVDLRPLDFEADFLLFRVVAMLPPRNVAGVVGARRGYDPVTMPQAIRSPASPEG